MTDWRKQSLFGKSDSNEEKLEKTPNNNPKRTYGKRECYIGHGTEYLDEDGNCTRCAYNANQD